MRIESFTPIYARGTDAYFMRDVDRLSCEHRDWCLRHGWKPFPRGTLETYRAVVAALRGYEERVPTDFDDNMLGPEIVWCV